jgi:hypothetical protein
MNRHVRPPLLAATSTNCEIVTDSRFSASLGADTPLPRVSN